MSFLNQRKCENDRRNDLTISLHDSYVVELGIELATPGFAIRRATDCAMEPDPDTLPIAYQCCPLKDLHGISCDRQTIYMKYQALCSLKKFKKKAKYSLLQL